MSEYVLILISKVSTYSVQDTYYICIGISYKTQPNCMLLSVLGRKAKLYIG